ncbi:MAG: methyltransferase [Lactobacillales bacterium]|jgi:tRNA1(Val) A37 N6-methylase TrmN6|nr:methyltransferase [Lactobacillales bacterium]
MTQYTTDDFLGGKVRLKQPEKGYRATSDAVLLAAAVPVKNNQSILDVGAATGIISLCLNTRAKNLKITAVELQMELADLLRENAVMNEVAIDILIGDVLVGIPELKGRQFQHVVTNPPFYTEDPKRADVQQETAYKQSFELKKWITFCLRHLSPKGTFTMIHRTESLPAILEILGDKLGGIEVIPILPKQDTPSKRIIIRGILGSKKPFKLHPGLVMHEGDDTRTDVAEAIMRRGEPII